MIVSITSLTVPPSALRMPRTSWNDISVTAARRLPPMGLFHGVRTGWRRAAGRAISSARPNSVICRSCVRGSSRFCCHAVKACRSRSHCSNMASAHASSGRGGSFGCQGSAGGGVGSGSGTRSSTASSNSMPETPSTRQWWTRLRYAVRSPSRPCIAMMSQSGRSRGSISAKRSPQSSRSCCCVPGAGSCTSFRWRSSENLGSSSHVGWPA